MVRHGLLRAEVAFLQKPFRPSVLTKRARECAAKRSPALRSSAAVAGRPRGCIDLQNRISRSSEADSNQGLTPFSYKMRRISPLGTGWGVGLPIRKSQPLSRSPLPSTRSDRSCLRHEHEQQQTGGRRIAGAVAHLFAGTSHSLADLSTLPEAMTLPSRLNPTENTSSVCPFNEANHFPVFTSQSRIVVS